MSKLLKRRDFLKGATGVAVGSVVAGGPVSAVAQAMGSGGPSVVPTLSYWDGAQFVPATKLASGDSSLGMVKVTFRTYGTQGRLLAIDQIVPVIGPKGMVNRPFHAWFAPPSGARDIQFEAPAGRGLKFQLKLVDGTSDLALVLGTSRQAKLREGLYVLSFASTAGYTYNRNQGANPVVNGVGPLAPGYLVITVERV